ncbi:hypothetical protein [Nonomuraea salmonea]|uniref:hypothetical protein n=1 Tax=Nonomuraea salmonea TaxID=46181 RepID=UPI0031E79F39
MGKRVGVLDMNTRQMLAWYELEHDVAAVAWSPDGTRILATAYSEYPDLQESQGEEFGPRMAPPARAPATTSSTCRRAPPTTTSWRHSPPWARALPSRAPLSGGLKGTCARTLAGASTAR